EDGLELRERLEGRIGAQVRVARDAQVRGHEVVEEATIPRGRQVLVRGEGQSVLLLAADAPLRRRDRLVLAHREAGAGLPVAGQRGREVSGTQARDGFEALGHGLRTVELEEGGAQL